MSEPDATTDRPTQHSSALHKALAYLLPGPAAPHLDAHRSAAAQWFVLIGLLIGIIYALLFAGIWELYGEYMRIRFLPAVFILALDVAWLGQRLVRGAARTADALWPNVQQPRPSALVPTVYVLLMFALLVSLPIGVNATAGDWRRLVGPLYPQPVLRPLVLMPIWGRWAMLLALSLGPPDVDASPLHRSVIAGVRLRTVVFWWLGAVVLTTWYCAEQGNVAAGLLVALLTMTAAYLTAVGLTWRFGAVCQHAVYAVGAVTELVFLLVYTPFANHIYGW
jgi:hypothetical protein